MPSDLLSRPRIGDLSLASRQRTIMASKSLPGPVHTAPPVLRQALRAAAKAQAAWKDLTPLARNEWICWVISAKQEATRGRRIERAIEDLTAGKRRPCCWPGCPHRRPSAKKWFEKRP
jgi:hypothetical protein